MNFFGAPQPGGFNAKRMTPAQRGGVIRSLWLSRRMGDLDAFLRQGPMEIADPDYPNNLVFCTLQPAERSELIRYLWSTGMVIGMGANPWKSEGGFFDFF